MKILNQNIWGKLLQRAQRISEQQVADVKISYNGFLPLGKGIEIFVYPKGWTCGCGWWEATVDSPETALKAIDALRSLELNGSGSDWKSSLTWREVK
jgi:hypothetical protein